MIFLIGGASHTGKTLLAQRLLERYGYPYLSIDHLKMGLIRSGQTSLTPCDDGELTGYLWPIVREMIKTAIENRQNLIVEGCYIPFDFKKDFSGEYLPFIKYVCLVFSEEYIRSNYGLIMSRADAIERRLDDRYPKTAMLEDNRQSLAGCLEQGCEYVLIDGDYDVRVDMDVVFESERLTFSRMSMSDFPSVREMLCDPEVMYAWGRGFTDGEVREWIEKRMSMYGRVGYDYFLARDRASGETVGQIGLLDETVAGERCAGLGCILNKRFRRMGYASEGARAMLRYAFGVLGRDRVIAEIRPENSPSVRVAERLGMRPAGTLTKIFDGKSMPHTVFELRRDDQSSPV